jgi:hypothetical protein
MRWLPTRAYENGVYAIYSNPIGVDGGTIKPVCPFSEASDDSEVSRCRVVGHGG